jgi:hypothetical protein
VFDCSLRSRDGALVAAYFVVARGREACPLVPPQHGVGTISV